MKLFTIKSTNEKTLHKGHYKTFKHCVEAANEAAINLEHANLSHSNLSNANLDGINLCNANFTGSNLTGANLSEANLSNSLFKDCDLYNTCLSESNLTNCDFTNASFGATDINGADISHSKFTTLSCFTLEFTQTKNMKNCEFTNVSGIKIPFSTPPIVIYGHNPQPLILLGNTFLKGHEISNQTSFIGILSTASTLISSPIKPRKRKNIQNYA
ncbi:pentapeptide repeat-containing protein [Alphaproteobacteria bacterium]|nr:pentapeptide repeat-containing protein [Alphaproteobacteria bacterium]